MGPIHLIAGPTASGKSARAIELANAQNGVILNADATQCYGELRILSARPDEAELAQAEHRLYGIWSGDKMASVADWLEAVKPEIEQCWQEERLPIICGGTGFYLKALMEGLSPIPDIPTEIREDVIRKIQTEGNEAVHQKLAAIDSEAANALPPENTQRLIRAYEVYLATGTPISEWRRLPKEPPFAEAQFTTEIITLPRAELYARCDARFENMLQAGALEEVEKLLTKNYASDLPIMKAVGVPELTAYLRSESSLEQAKELAQRNTRRYAKRQLTWLRNQF